MDVLGELSERLAGEHAEALRWFARHEGEIGPRPWGAHRPADAPAGLKLVAQRGIHVPNGFRFALSVNSTLRSRYGDGKPLSLADGTWLLPYAEHAGGDGTGTESRWNRGLMECWLQRVPVGVTYEVAQSQYRNLGLAFVEDYDPRAGFFLLHGPVRMGVDKEVWTEGGRAQEELPEFVAREVPPTSEALRRRLAWSTAREDQGRFRAALLALYRERCAISGYDVAESLQAAHILNYSGRLSQVPQNGILLRADLHLLFDEHLLAVNPDTMRAELAPSIRNSRYAALHAQPLNAPLDEASSPSPDRLSVHYEVCSRAWAGRRVAAAGA